MILGQDTELTQGNPRGREPGKSIPRSHAFSSLLSSAAATYRSNPIGKYRGAHYFHQHKLVSVARKLGGKGQIVYLKGHVKDIWHIVSYWNLL